MDTSGQPEAISDHWRRGGNLYLGSCRIAQQYADDDPRAKMHLAVRNRRRDGGASRQDALFVSARHPAADAAAVDHAEDNKDDDSDTREV